MNETSSPYDRIRNMIVIGTELGSDPEFLSTTKIAASAAQEFVNVLDGLGKYVQWFGPDGKGGFSITLIGPEPGFKNQDWEFTNTGVITMQNEGEEPLLVSAEMIKNIEQFLV